MPGWLQKILLCFLFCFAIWAAGLAWFIRQIPDSPADDARTCDAIVVLTGGSGRLEYGFKLLAEGKGKVMFITGVSYGITTDMLLKKIPEELRPKVVQQKDLPVVLGHHAENTIGNAEETARWLHRQHYSSICLVTANYHMPRSLSEFNELLPDITIIPELVMSDELSLSNWWEHEDSRILMLLEYHKFLVGQLRHWLVSVMHRT